MHTDARGTYHRRRVAQPEVDENPGEDEMVCATPPTRASFDAPSPHWVSVPHRHEYRAGDHEVYHGADYLGHAKDRHFLVHVHRQAARRLGRHAIQTGMFRANTPETFPQHA